MHQLLFERLLSTATMLAAQQELIDMGAQAAPILASLLNGDAKNSFGVPYRELGLPLRCALETAIRLGQAAKQLEPLLVKELANGDCTAATALGALGTLGQESVDFLAHALDGSDGNDPEHNLAFESAAAILRCGELGNPSIQKRISQSEPAANLMRQVQKIVGL